MARGFISHLSNEQKGAFWVAFITAIGAFAAAASISVPFWFAANSWLTKTISMVILFFSTIIIFSAIFFYYRTLSRKEIIYRVLSLTPIVETNKTQVTPTLLKDLVVMYKGQAQSSLYLELIEFRNVGNTRITLNDFKPKGIALRFAMGASILGADIKTTDSYFAPQCVVETKEDIQIKPFEIDPGDFMTLRVFLASDKYGVRINPLPNTGTNFPIQQVDDTNTRNKKILKRLQIFFNVVTPFLLVSSLVLFIIVLFALPQINFWFLISLLGAISIVYLCIIVSRVFNFIILSKQPKI
jgi:hypothetical protein